MLPPSVEKVVSYYYLIDAGDVPNLVLLFDAECTYMRPGYPPLHGRTALQDFYMNTRVIAEGHHTVEGSVYEGDTVAVHGQFNGTLRDGSQVSTGFADFFYFNESGMIISRRTYFDVPVL